MGKVNIIQDGIYEIENFISDSDIKYILSFVNLVDDKGWKYFNKGSVQYDINPDELPPEYFLCVNNIQNRILDYFTNVTKSDPIFFVKRLKEQEHMPLHKDLGPDMTDPIRFGIVLYLNDDFSGGELYYKDIDLKIKPKRGSLMIHKSTLEHKVLTVQEGKRYFMTSFIFGDEETNVKTK